MKILTIAAILLSTFLTQKAQAQGWCSHASYENATFAGDCFWCMESVFEKLAGVVEVTSGYTGRRKENPLTKRFARELLDTLKQ